MEKLSRFREIQKEEGIGSAFRSTFHFFINYRNYDPLNYLIYLKSKSDIETRAQGDAEIDDILDTVLEIHPGSPPYELRAGQLRTELEQFIKFIDGEDPKTVLEIGTLRGGSLYCWIKGLSHVKKVVSVDYPSYRPLIRNRKKNIWRNFSKEVDLNVVWGNSHHPNTYENTANLIDDGVDFLFIDGDHTYEGVKNDFEMYSPLVVDGGIVAFHDIIPHAKSETEKHSILSNDESIEEKHVTINTSEWGVHQYWHELKSRYETEQFISHPNQRGKGIGVIKI